MTAADLQHQYTMMAPVLRASRVGASGFLSPAAGATTLPEVSP